MTDPIENAFANEMRGLGRYMGRNFAVAGYSPEDVRTFMTIEEWPAVMIEPAVEACAEWTRRLSEDAPAPKPRPGT